MISNSHELPLIYFCTTDKRLDIAFVSNNNNIEKIIQNLDLHKAQVHDKITIRMMKNWGKSIFKHLEVILGVIMSFEVRGERCFL